MEATTHITTVASPRITGPTTLLRLATDEKLVEMTRAGNASAFEALVGRYQARLLSFCRHMLASKEDAEDVLQEVFAAAYNALLADERAVNVRPWLYRIARNRSLNHLRKRTAIGVDSMDVHFADHGTSTADRVHQREDFRQLMVDVQGLPETQRTALLLREVDALSYDQIAEAMETTVPSIKSLLVRARVSLAEAAEARALTCEEARDELGNVAEGIASMTQPVRRHVKQCTRCAAFKKHLRANNKQLAAIFPLGPLLLLKKFVLAQAGGAGAVAGTAAAGSSALNAGLSTLASKAAAGMAAAALLTAGAVEIPHAQSTRGAGPAESVAASIVVKTNAPRIVNEQPRAPVAAMPAEVTEPPEATSTEPVVAELVPTPAATVPPQQVIDSTSLPSEASAPPVPAPAGSVISPAPEAPAPPVVAPIVRDPATPPPASDPVQEEQPPAAPAVDPVQELPTAPPASDPVQELPTAPAVEDPDAATPAPLDPTP